MSIILGSLLFWGLSAFAASNTCIECHTDELDKPFKHKAAVEDCSSCHDPDHEVRTGHPYRLYEATNKLCLKCHEFRPGFPSYGNASVGHPIDGHPTSRMKDPLHPEREFNCISCHNPHSSKMETLFRYDYSKNSVYQGHLCAVCHWNIIFVGEPPTPPPWHQ
ncbi:MAG: hypothetical protein A2X86_10085 [Bdellovibrionales bacterium GWA2_49_15]|nr:MAG: hypothetical protein A2X86_10085 [Bdellovibrionales bacterium GWA2_49_15]